MFYTNHAKRAVAPAALLVLRIHKLGQEEWQRGQMPLLGDLADQAVEELDISAFELSHVAHVLSIAAETAAHRAGYQAGQLAVQQQLSEQ